VFADVDVLHALGLDAPPVSRLAQLVSNQIPGFPTDLLTMGAFADAVSLELRCIER
jgi:hypothetical protein